MAPNIHLNILFPFMESFARCQECYEADRAADVILLRRSQFIQSGDTEL